MTSSSKTKFKATKTKDPFAAREAQKYERPIPSREFILGYLADFGAPMTREELAESFGLTDEDGLEALRRRLKAMERDGQLLRNRRDCYCLINKKDLISGRVIGHPDGFGFVKPDEDGDDLFLSPKQMRILMHNDRVVVRVRGIDRRGRKEAALVEVLERNTHRVVGRLHMESGINFIVPDHKRIVQEILVPDSHLNGAAHGQIVLAEIIEQPERRKQAIGRVIEILGDHMAPGMEIEIAIRAHDLPCEWPPDVEDELAGLNEAVEEDAKRERIDLRDLPLVTIDGEDAKDFDDAVFCERKPKGWRLLVAIADVSHYVSPESALDQEGRKRGNSVYFPEHVIPMLPELLSNGLCSLKPDVDRLCMVCELSISVDGEIKRSRFFDAVMHSHGRLTYTEVAAMVCDKNKRLRKKYKDLAPHLDELHALFTALHRQRLLRGAIEFDSQESRIVFGDARKIEKIVPVMRNDAHRMIEEFMVSANAAAARYLRRKKMPRLLRIHEGPAPEKIADLRTFLGEMGLHLGGPKKPNPSDYATLAEKVRKRPDAHLIQTVMLRSMSQAEYSPEPIGHFGLALETYTHFTSPIRRYPDLIIHRAIRHCLEGKAPDLFRYSHADMVAIGEQSSSTERRADEATRDVMSWLKCEYMLDKLGEEFEGIITSVTAFGFFAELKDIFVEGLVHISTLGRDYFHFDPIGHRLDGERSGVSYRLGDTVKVIVSRVDLDEKKIDFDLSGVNRQRRTRKK